MKHIHFLFIILLVALPRFIFSQERKIKLTCDVHWDTTSILLLQHYPYNEQKDSIYFSKIKFYLSNLHFIENNKKSSVGEAYLFDLENKLPFYITYNEKGSPGKIGFLLGVDSLTNVSGAYQGDLDPTKGMYWTWQSGYINIKIEGELMRADGSSETFHYHLGGYRAPFVASKNLLFDIKNKQNEIKLTVSLNSFMRFAMESEVKNIMSPGYKAKELTDIFANTIRID